jgi:hypothetical protein
MAQIRPAHVPLEGMLEAVDNGTFDRKVRVTLETNQEKRTAHLLGYSKKIGVDIETKEASAVVSHIMNKTPSRL